MLVFAKNQTVGYVISNGWFDSNGSIDFDNRSELPSSIYDS